MNEKPQDKNPVTSPYVGLMPFTEKEAPYFFGRTADQEIIATNLRAARMTIFYGASGVGKSSLLNAGVLPYLRRIATASILPDEPPEFILVVNREWANNPIDSLRLRIKEAVETAVKEGKIPHLKPEDVEKTARANEQNCNLSELLKNWTELIKTSLLIILDQFEDFFLHPEFMSGEGSFGEEFPKAVNNKELHVNYMISLRDDALSKLDFFKGKIQDPMKNTLRLLHLDRDATGEAICKPLEKYNEISGESFTIDEKLVEKLLDDLQVDKVKFDTQGQAAVNVVDTIKGETQAVSNGYRVETPYLQLVMERLWKDENTQHAKHLTLETLEHKLGGVQKIVETHLDEVMNQFSDEDKELAAEFMHFTVTRSGAKIPADANDLADWAELPDREQGKKDIKRILSQLSTGKRRIFKEVANRNDIENPFYEVSHDALGPAILSWRKRINDIKLQRLALQEAEEKRRKELAEVERDKEEQARKLQAEQERRENQERLLEAERKSRKLGRIVVALATLFAVVLAGAGIYYWEVRARRKEERAAALRNMIENHEEEVERYKSLIAILAALHSGQRGTVNIALSQLEEKAKNGQLPDEYKTLFIDALNDTRVTTSNNALKLENTLAAVKQSQAKIETPTGESPTFVFIHVPQPNPNADKVRNLLKNESYIVPAPIVVGEKGNVRNAQIRYFRKTDDVIAIAEEIRKVLLQHNIEAVTTFIGGFEQSPSVRPRQFELWITGDQMANAE